jgi:hypothetical protein
VMDRDAEELAGLRIRFAEGEPVALGPEFGASKASAQDELAHELAYKFACLVIETACVQVDIGQFGLREEGIDADALDDFRDAVRYLDARGLLYRDPERPNVGQVVDECEATS